MKTSPRPSPSSSTFMNSNIRNISTTRAAVRDPRSADLLNPAAQNYYIDCTEHVYTLLWTCFHSRFTRLARAKLDENWGRILSSTRTAVFTYAICGYFHRFRKGIRERGGRGMTRYEKMGIRRRRCGRLQVFILIQFLTESVYHTFMAYHTAQRAGRGQDHQSPSIPLLSYLPDCKRGPGPHLQIGDWLFSLSLALS